MSSGLCQAWRADTIAVNRSECCITWDERLVMYILKLCIQSVLVTSTVPLVKFIRLLGEELNILGPLTAKEANLIVCTRAGALGEMGHNADTSSSGMPLKWDSMAVADLWGTAFKDMPDVDSYVEFSPAFHGTTFKIFQLIPVGEMMHSTDFRKYRRTRTNDWICEDSIAMSCSHGHLGSVASIVSTLCIYLFFWRCL